MTTKQFQVVFAVVMGLCLLTAVVSSALFDFIDADTAASWTMKYFSLPILLLAAPGSYFIYFRFIRQHEIKEYKSKTWTQLRTMFRIFLLTFGTSAILLATTQALIILTNAYVGDSKTIHLNAKIVDYESSTSKGQRQHYIKIQDQQLDRIVELKVGGRYKPGQRFNKTMKIGYWGLLYSEK